MTLTLWDIADLIFLFWFLVCFGWALAVLITGDKHG